MFKWLIILIFSCNAHSIEINRKVLVLWDSSEVPSPEYTYSLTHSKLEVILNHYGLMNSLTYILIGNNLNERH